MLDFVALRVFCPTPQIFILNPPHWKMISSGRPLFLWLIGRILTFCDIKYRILTFCNKTESDSLSGSLWLAVRLSLNLSGLLSGAL